jgi:hypothetical protein
MNNPERAKYKMQEDPAVWELFPISCLSGAGEARKCLTVFERRML